MQIEYYTNRNEYEDYRTDSICGILLGGDALLLSLIRYIKGYLRISISSVYSPEKF